MAVPKTTMREYCCPVTGKNDVRTSRQGANLQAEAKARTVEHLPELDFWLGVTSADPAHHAAARGAGNDVSHESQGERELAACFAFFQGKKVRNQDASNLFDDRNDY